MAACETAGLSHEWRPVRSPGGDSAISALVSARSTDLVVVRRPDLRFPFPEGFDDQALRAALGDIPDMSLVDGVAKTVDHFRAALADGRLA